MNQPLKFIKVGDNQVSSLHIERIYAGIDIQDGGKTYSIIVTSSGEKLEDERSLGQLLKQEFPELYKPDGFKEI